MENKALGSSGLTAALERINSLLQEKATKTELENYTTLTKINQILGDYVKTTDYTTGMNNKVDKVSGKGLSTNDFTTAEKNKLATLENYDDTALVEQVSQLEQNINTVIGEGATEAIENFKEILDFLAGIADTETLQGLISNLKSTIESEIATKSDIGHTHTASDITDFTPQVKTLQAADTLDSAPTESTLTHIVNGVEVPYQIGEFVRVPDDASETGFSFAQLIDNTDGVATWSNGDSASTAGYTMYRLHNVEDGVATWAREAVAEAEENVTVSISSNQGTSDSSLIGASVSVIDTSDGATLYEETWNGEALQFTIVAGTTYSVSFGDITGYKTPDAVEYTAEAGNQREISVSYSTCILSVSISGLENGATAQATVSYNGNSYQVASGGTVKVPHATQITVSVPTVSFHVTPSAQTFTTEETSKAVSFAYIASKLYVSILSNQSNDTTIASTKATVSYGSTSLYVSNGSVIYIPNNQTVKVTYPAVTGYKTPSAVSIYNGSGGQAAASGTYKTEIVTVTVTAEDSSSVAGQQITINGNVFTLDSTGVCTSKIPFDVQYSITLNDKSGYTTPSSQTFTASQVSRTVYMVYETIKLGVYIQDKNGKLWATDSWDTSNNSNANAIAVVTSNVKLLVALTDSGKTMQIHSSDTGTLENYMTAISDETKAKADYKGVENTANIMKLQSSTSYAAGWCNAFTFPDSKTKGHLPSLGEFWEVFQNKSLVDAALSKCGGTAIYTSNYHKSSTFWGIGGNQNRRRCWVFNWSDGSSDDYRIDSSFYVRAFANL